MLSHNAKYYSKSITASKIDVKKMFCNTFCKRNFISLSVFTPNPSHIFTFVFEEKENMKTNFNLKSNLPVPML